jgi:hypothetical protein
MIYVRLKTKVYSFENGGIRNGRRGAKSIVALTRNISKGSYW